MIIDLSDYNEKDSRLYDCLYKLKQDKLPDDFRLQVIYNRDSFNNDNSPGIMLTKLQELLTLLDFPNFFVSVHTSYSNVTNNLSELRNKICPYETDISVVITDVPFVKDTKPVDSICVLPWIHLYTNPQGQVGPCCLFDESYPVGHASTTLSVIANNDNMKSIRKQMLDGQRPNSCSICWKKEDAGLRSHRQSMNERWEKYLPLTKQTEHDGSFPEFKLRYLDFRASNICNLKCRSCGGKYSSKIAQEDASLYGNRTMIELKLTGNEITSMLQFIENSINDLEEVYFAGGEPLLMEEHYAILDILLKHRKTDIKLFYNTNLTKLKYKSINVVDYWQQFSNVEVNASIDASGTQAEYIRSGTVYKDIEDNYFSIKDIVSFKISSIVHILNIYNLQETQRRWISELGLNPKNILFNPLTYPEYMSVQVLPESHKQQATAKINAHIQWLKTVENAQHLVDKWNNTLIFMNHSDQSHLLQTFFKSNDLKDKYRHESFDACFPEFSDFRSYSKNNGKA